MSPSCIRNKAAKVCCNKSSVLAVGEVVEAAEDELVLVVLACEVALDAAAADEEPDTHEEEEGWDLANARRKSGHVWREKTSNAVDKECTLHDNSHKQCRMCANTARVVCWWA